MTINRCLPRRALCAFLLLLCPAAVAYADDVKPAPSACALVVQNTKYDNVFFPTEEKSVIVSVQNLTAAAKTTELTMQGMTDDGKPLQFKQSVDLAANATVDVPVTLELKEPCFADCTFSLGNDAPSVHTAFAVVRPPDLEAIPFDKCCYGVCNIGHPQTAKRIGVRFLRTAIFWKWSNPKPGVYNFARYTDTLKEFENAGIPVIYTLEPNYPDWVGVSHMVDLGQPAQLEKFATWAAAAIKAMPPGPKAFEINNEPDISLGRHGDVNVGIATTAALLKRGYDLVKAADPSVPVLGVDVSSGGPRNRDFATKSLQQAEGKIDEYSVHAYSEQHYVKTDGSVVWPDEYMAEMMAPNVQLADQYTHAKGIWSTEMGWAYPWEEIYLSDSARTFAQIVAQSLVMVKTIPHFEKVTWFRGSAAWGTNERGYDYSLLVQGFKNEKGNRPCTGVNAFATVSSLLEGSDTGEKLDLGPALHGYLFANAATHRAIAAVWAVKYDVSLSTPTPAGTGIIDIYGRQRSVIAGEKWAVNRGPSFFVTDLAKAAELKTFLTSAHWRPDQPFVVANVGAASSKALDAKITNFLSEDAKVDVALPTGTVKATLHPGDNIVSIPLAADAFQTAHLDLPLKITSGQATTNYHVDKQLVAAAYAAPGTLAVDGALTAAKTALAKTVLQDREYVFPTDPTVPWKGPEDLSLKFGYAWNEQGLYTLIVARDDILIAMPDAEGGFWGYDSLQMAFGPGGNRAGIGYQPGDHEISLVLTTTGKSKLFQPFPTEKVSADVQYKVTRTGQDTIYEGMLPWKYLLGVDQPPQNAVFAMNFIVNDNDGSGRKCWMGLYDGIADGKRPAYFPWVHLLPKAGR